MKKKIFIFSTITVLIIGVSITIGFVLFLPWTLPENPKTIDIVIDNGMTPQSIAGLLKNKEVITSRQRFVLAAKILGVTKKLQAGEYQFKGSLSNYSILRKLSRGKVIYEKVTFPEGIRMTQIADILGRLFEVDCDRFKKLANDSAFCRSLNIDSPSLEGFLYPDTYYFQREPKPELVLKTMVKRFHQVVADSLRDRAAELNMSMHDLVTLASIVEGEAVIDSERTVIAAIYMNRLKRNMRLQACPTIQYIIEDGPRRLLTKDLEIDSPYNTYIHRGLPPGPVNNPGIASILATLYPVSVNYMYMVANGDGSHTFSLTMREHIRAKHRFDQVRRSVR
jgi:UPF0755 protein